MTWEEVLEMQRKGQAASQKNRSLAAQGAQESAQAAKKAEAEGISSAATIGTVVGTVAGGVVGGPIGASLGGTLGGQLGGAAAGGDIDTSKIAMSAATNAASPGIMDSMAGKAAGQVGMANAGISGEQADMLSDQMQGFGLSDRMDTGQFFKQGGPVKHYKGGGTTEQTQRYEQGGPVKTPPPQVTAPSKPGGK